MAFPPTARVKTKLTEREFPVWETVTNMPNLPIKITQISKDFDIKSKDVLDIFKDLGIEKKSGASADIDEFELFLSHLTSSRQIKDLDAYREGKTKIKSAAEKKEEKPAPAPKAEEQKPAEKKPAPEVKSEQKPAPAPKAAPKPQQQNPKRMPSLPSSRPSWKNCSPPPAPSS